MLNFFKKYKMVVIIIMFFILLTSLYFNIVKTSGKNYNGFTIVLDAGHGGRDGGSVGVNGTIEKEINLDYVLCLKQKLVTLGYRVVLTRKDDNGLYSPLASNKKISDMNKRMEIIKKSNPNLVLSLHMNSFSDKSARGAVCYHKIDDKASIQCADLIQQSLNKNLNTRLSKSKKGDYFMLNCSYYTSVLVECGFLSNTEEERLLNTEEYKQKFTDAVCSGILLYLGYNST